MNNANVKINLFMISLYGLAMYIWVSVRLKKWRYRIYGALPHGKCTLNNSFNFEFLGRQGHPECKNKIGEIAIHYNN